MIGRDNLIAGAIALALLSAALFAVYSAGGRAAEARAKPKIETAVEAHASASLEAQAGRETAVRVTVANEQLRALDDVLALSLEAARNAADANEPIPADRAERLRVADDGLCGLRPSLEGCPQPAR